MIRSIAAVLTGLVVATIAVGLATVVATRLMLPAAGPGAMPTPTAAYLAVNLVYSFLAALLGGWLAARIAARAPLGHGMAVGTIMLVLGFLVAAMPSDGAQGSQPGWYLFVVPVLGWVGATTGGMLRREKGEATSEKQAA